MLYRNMKKKCMKMLKKYFDDVITLVLYVQKLCKCHWGIDLANSKELQRIAAPNMKAMEK